MINHRVVVTALAPAIWGTTFYVTTEYLPPDRPLLASLLRALPAGLMLIALARELPRGEWWWRSLVLGALNIGAFTPLLFLAAYRLPGGVAATLLAIQPLFVAALASRFLGQRLTIRILAAGLAGLLGVSLLVLKAGARLDALGVAAALGGAAVTAAAIVLNKRWVSPASALATTGWQLVAGGIVLVPLTFALEDLPTFTRNVAGYAFLSVFGGAVAYVVWIRGITLLTATQVTFLGLLTPVVAAIIGWAALGQQLTAVQLLGAAIVLTAMTVAQMRTQSDVREIRV
ncbi:ABC transporter permease [Lentzea aerocolonigenes]|uniref:ABC transporter permease n=1 Tax=Lentzea aerocolonigenes TaxID=68170 RepID=A0A0F0G9U7_LENAE|nr:EamA family transporter [Lentzea aerocolonigenes]KJK32999.1 ABC transporter permease [Lentzea aerocolonigenes]